MYWYGFDWYYFVLVVPAILFALFAQSKVSGTFRKYSQVQTRRGLTGAQAAAQVLSHSGLTDVRIESIQGKLTDHYDPRDNVIRLSSSVYSSTSVAAVGVAAHEAGHAVQYATNYAPIRVRSAIIPISRFGSALSWPLVLIGLFLNNNTFFVAGIIFFAMATLFQVVTLPVEFNASHRAMTVIESSGILEGDELPMARKTLSAAAMTYVAALAVSLAQLLRLLLIFGGRRDD